MSSLTTYKDLSVVTPDPIGLGGLAINNNFKSIADSLAGSVPYTGATSDLNMGIHNLTANIVRGNYGVFLDNLAADNISGLSDGYPYINYVDDGSGLLQIGDVNAEYSGLILSINQAAQVFTFTDRFGYGAAIDGMGGYSIDGSQVVDEFRQLYYDSGVLLTDSSDNIYLSGNASEGFFLGTTGYLIVDKQLQFYYANGNLLTDTGPRLYFPTGNLFLGDTGIIYSNQGSTFVDAGGNIYVPFYLYDSLGSSGVAGNIPVNAGNGFVWKSTASALNANSTTLVSGTKAITISGLTSSNKAFVQLTAPGGTLGAAYKAVCTTNILTITAVSVAGVTVTTDTSTLNYFYV